MMPGIVGRQTAERKPKITCITCEFKKCIGLCRFETVACPLPSKSA